MANSKLLHTVKSVLDGQIGNGVTLYSGARITSSGFRSLDEQIKFVKERPTQYSRTLTKFFKEFSIDPKKMNDPVFLKTVYDGHDAWLRKTILEIAAEGGSGFRHLSGMAVDVSVRNLDSAAKKLLFNDIVNKGLYVLLEKVAAEKTIYGVPIESANVFHIELRPGVKQILYLIR